MAAWRPVGHRHPAEVLGGGPGDVQVALGEHGHPGGRGEQALGRVPGEVGVLGVGRRRAALDAGAEAVAGPFVEGPVADDDVGHPGGHGHGRLVDGGAGRPAAVVDAAEEGQLAHAEGAGHLDLGVGVGRESDHAVDVGGSQTGVIEGGGHRLGGQAQLAAARVLGEFGGPDTADGGRPGEGVVTRRPGAHDDACEGLRGGDGQGHPHRAGDVVAPAVGAPHRDLDHAPPVAPAFGDVGGRDRPVKIMVSPG